jgi:hypothetical protein
MACRGLASACLAGAAASAGCSALLSLDVQYADRADASSEEPPDGTSGDLRDASPPSEASPDGLATIPDGHPDAPRLDGATDTATPPGPDGSPPMVTLIASVQGNNDWKNGAAGPVVVPLTSPVAAHDTIIVATDVMPANTLQVTDSLHNTYSMAVTVPTTGNESCWIFYALDVAAGTDSISVNAPANTFGEVLEVYVQEYSGIGAFDVATGKTGTTADMHSGFVTTTAPGDLIFGYGVAGFVTTGTGFNQRLHLNNNLTEDQIAPGAGMVEATATMTMGDSWAMMVAAFKAR